jgi:hypothetical protein
MRFTLGVRSVFFSGTSRFAHQARLGTLLTTLLGILFTLEQKTTCADMDNILSNQIPNLKLDKQKRDLNIRSKHYTLHLGSFNSVGFKSLLHFSH